MKLADGRKICSSSKSTGGPKDKPLSKFINALANFQMSVNEQQKS